jgi:hypothetical protein
MDSDLSVKGIVKIMKYLKLHLLLFITVLIVFILTQSCSVQSGKTITEKRIETLIDSISIFLNQYYVFPEIAKRIEVQLKNDYVKGHFSKIKNDEEFAEKVNLEMKSIANDLHLRFEMVSGSRSPGSKRYRAPNYNYQMVYGILEFGFFRTGKMENDIGYLEILGFPPLKSSKESIDGALKSLIDSKALVIDLRRNGGGIPETIMYICSYFFEKPTHINSIYWRYLDTTVDFITLEKVGGQKMVNTPICVLISSNTISGGEEFAYDIQTQKRGVLIGEVTAGGANPSDILVFDNFRISIPTGRAINPITKTNWEGVGVKPDYEIEASKALELSCEKALLLIK